MFWNGFFDLPESPEDVFNLFSQKEIRQLCSTAPKNLRNLVKKCTSCISDFCVSNATRIQVLNAIRILTRILPLVFENEELQKNIFWDVSETGVSLGKGLVTGVVKLFFCQDFTTSQDPNSDSKVRYSIWYKGVGCNEIPPCTREFINNRIEVVRLLICLCSGQIYHAPKEEYQDPFTLLLCSENVIEKKAMLSLMCSLINAAVGYDPSQVVPYNHVLFTDYSDRLSALACQLLIILLDFKGNEKLPTPVAESASTKSAGMSFMSPTVPDYAKTLGNELCYYFSRIHKQKDYDFIILGITRLVVHQSNQQNTLLPNSIKRVDVFPELISLLWKILHLNEKLIEHMMTNQIQATLDLTGAIAFYLQENRQNMSSIGTLRLCAYIIHKFSEYRAFGVALNTNLTSNPSVLKHLAAFSGGTWADLWYLNVYAFISNTLKLPTNQLHEHMLISMSNTSPYVKSIHATTAKKALLLFSVFSSSYFLLSDEPNHKLLFYILEALNNLVQYQMDGNIQLIYACFAVKHKINALNELDFEKAVAEFEERIQKANKAAGKQPIPSDSNESLSNEIPVPTRNFKPQKSWFDFWKGQLPLNVLLQLTEKVESQIAEFCVTNQVTDEQAAMQFLSKTTLVGLIPAPAQVFKRRLWRSNEYNSWLRVWFYTYFWGIVYIKNSGQGETGEIAKMCPPLFNGTLIKLFQIKSI